VLTANVNTGADGSASISYVGPPDPSGGNDPAVTDTITAFWDKDGDNNDDGAAEFDDTVSVQWDDAVPRDDSAVLAPNNASGLVNTARTVTATVTDKFGQPIPGVLVEFQMTGAVAQTSPQTTSASGVASLTYTGPAASGTTTIDARVDITDDGDYADPDDLDIGEVANVTHFWVETAQDIPLKTEFDLVAVSTSTSSDFIDVQLANGAYVRLGYDANDQFFVNAVGKTLAEFEAALAGLTLPSLDGPGNVSLETEPYDVGGITLFRLET
jgi:hypothetical protein